MKKISLVLLSLSLSLVLSLPSVAQPPQRPLLPLIAYTLSGYEAIDVGTAFTMPAGVEFASVAALAFDSRGHLIVLHRGEQPFLEFDGQGNYVRSFGASDLFVRSHGLRIDANDDMWVTDVSGHVVMKLDSDANILLTIGTPGQSGLWNESTGTHLFDQPNEVAFDSHGNFYVAQGHGPAEPRILKFNAEGKFIKQWGSRGDGEGELAVAHSIEIDDNDIIYVADRENFRIQQFDTDGNYLDQWTFNAMACAIYLHDDGFMYMTTGFDGELAKLDMQGNVIGSIGEPGKENGQFGEGHFLTVDHKGDVYIADVVNRRVQVYAKK